MRPLIGLPLCRSAGAQHGPVQDRLGVPDFARTIYIKGAPYDEAIAFTSEDSAILLDMLRNEENALYWPNVTTLLGVIGDDDVVRPLIDFVHGRDSFAESTTVYRGRLSGIMALGYLVNKSSNTEALAYLLDSVDPQVWMERDISWLARLAASENAERLRVQLSASAILALALTGRDDAANRLDELLTTESTPARLRQVAESALPELAEIGKHGLSAYYRTDESAPQAAAARR